MHIEPDPALLVRPFPMPGPTIQLAYRELQIDESGTKIKQKIIGDTHGRARPWDPATCTDRMTRRQLWTWLDEVVGWLNHEYAWDVGTSIVPCWPAHPVVVRELAILADRRYRAETAITSDDLYEWHRLYLPGFYERSSSAAGIDTCGSEHGRRPARAEVAEYVAAPRQASRAEMFALDLDSDELEDEPPVSRRPQFVLLDVATGELA